MAKESTSLTSRQQVWLAAYAAAVASGKYNPKNEAQSCLNAFDEQFNGKKPEVVETVSTTSKTINFAVSKPETDKESDK